MWEAPIKDKDVCFSGGADGSDKEWADTAERHGHKAIDFTFEGHKGSKHNPRRCVLTQDQLNSADPFVIKANASLKRTFPTGRPFVDNLLRRNFYQVKDADSVYAVAGIDGHSVFGGTAWAIEMFKILRPNSDKIYVYDEASREWFQWNFAGWMQIGKPPRPEGRWAGIGTRQLDDCGLNAIHSIFS